jgi:hypothetical protein
MFEAVSMVKVTVVSVPDEGTFPVPVHPVHLYRVPPDWLAGLVTLAVIEVPGSYQLLPTAGFGESRAEVTYNLYWIL